MTSEMLKQAIPALLIAALLSGGARADGVGPAAGWPTGGGAGGAREAAGAPAGTATTAEAGTDGKSDLLAGLSPGDRKIASALYEAQGKGGIRLGDIARARRDGSGWSEIFKRMKADGLVREENVGQVISRHAGREAVGEAASAADADKRSQARSKGRPANDPSAATARSKLKPTARPAGGRPGRRSLLTLAFAAQAPLGGVIAAGAGRGRS